MSVACGIAWLGDVPGLLPVDDCTALVRCGVLDRAPGAGLRTLSSFLSCSPDDARAMYESYAECDPEELPSITFPPEQFFPAPDGLATVRAHTAFFTANPNHLRDVPVILEELRDFDRVLSALAVSGVPFHLTIVL